MTNKPEEKASVDEQVYQLICNFAAPDSGPYTWAKKAELRRFAKALKPLYAAPVSPQALTEGVAGLVERLTSRAHHLDSLPRFEMPMGDVEREAATALASLAAELAEANLDRCFASDSDPACKLEHKFVAEATELRRKLQEQRKALEAGRILANVAYNICQLSGLSDGHRASLKEAQVAFDEALLSGARSLAGDSK